jgi:hypothetical protein
MQYLKNCVDRPCGLVVRVPGCRSIDPGFDSRRYQIFWYVVGMERGPLSLVSTNEELLGRKSSGSGLEIRKYGCEDLLRLPHDTLCPQKLTLTSPTSDGRSVSIVHSWTEATEFVLFEVWASVVYNQHETTLWKIQYSSIYISYGLNWNLILWCFLHKEMDATLWSEWLEGNSDSTCEMIIFWDLVICSVVQCYQWFWGTWCLHLHGRED